MSIPIRIASMGPADHGKSTLFGMLVLHHIGSDAYWRKIDTYKNKSTWYRPDRAYTYMFDRSIDEKAGHLSMDKGYDHIGASMFPTHVQCKIDGRKYLFIDVPGHDKFIKNTTRGIFQAQTCVLVVSAPDINEVILSFVEKESSKDRSDSLSKHRAYKIANILMCPVLCRTYGIKNIILVLSKMDLIQYNSSYYKLAMNELVPRLINYSGLHKENINIVPTSIDVLNRSEINVITPVPEDHEMSWYDGPTLLNKLKQLDILEPISGPLLMPVETVFLKQVDNVPLILTGRILRGQLEEGQMVQVIPLYDRSTLPDRPKKIQGRVKSIRSRGESKELPWIGKFSEERDNKIDIFEAGHVIGINLHLIKKYSWAKQDEGHFKRGCIVTDPNDEIILGNIIHAEVFVPVYNRPLVPSECWVVFLFGRNTGEALILSSSIKEGPFLTENGEEYSGYLVDIKLMLNFSMAYPLSTGGKDISLRDIVLRHHDSFCGGRVLDLFYPEAIEVTWNQDQLRYDKAELEIIISELSQTSKLSCNWDFKEDKNGLLRLTLSKISTSDIKVFFNNLEDLSSDLSSVNISIYAKQ